MQCAALAIGGLSPSTLGWSLTAEQESLLVKAGTAEQEPSFFNEQQRGVISAIAEATIPRTETPGAIDAGVPRYIESMVRDWMRPDEQHVFMHGLEDLMAAAKRVHRAPFDELSEPAKLQLLETLEKQAEDAPWYNLGFDLRANFGEEMPFICMMKDLTIWGFFTSEVGAKQVLAYNPMPMAFDGDTPLDRGQSSWSGAVL